MLNFAYETQGTNTYLVYEIKPTDELDTMSLGMLTNNTIPGFAAASFTQMDTTKYIKYNVSAKVSVSQLFSGAVNKKRLLGVFGGIVSAMMSAEDYMLDANNLLLDLDHIFADVSTCETLVICLPVMNTEQKNPDLGSFFKNIIFNTQFDQTENCDHVAQILNYLNSNPILSLADFKELLDRLSRINGPAAMPQRPAAAGPAYPVAGPAQQPVTPQPVTPQPVTQQVVQQTPSRTVQSFVQTPPANAVPPRPVNPQGAANYAQPVNPVGQGRPPVTAVPQTPQQPQGKPMSMFYLLQHYNKENAAIYKAQQEAKKARKGNAPKPAQPKSAPVQPVNPGFAVPGQQPANPGFAVPGQQPVNPNFAVPGRQPAAPAYGAAQQKPAAPAYGAAQQKPAGFAVPGQTPAQPVQKPAARQPAAPVYQQPAAPAKPINFGETTVLSGAVGDTTVLSAAAEPNKMDPHLIRVKNNEKIPLNKPVFRIGKERSYVDYFIGDNTAISRSHANIVNHNGEFFAVDTNSTNHTYVNGGMIASNVETKLSHGTKIRLANEDFEFRLY